MKTQYFGVQIKQFVLSTSVIALGVIGVSISNSLDHEYVAKVIERENAVKEAMMLAEQEKQAQEKLEDVALNK